MFIVGFCALIESSVVLNDIIPVIKDMVVDSSQYVRASVASNISGLAPIVGKDKYFSQINILVQLRL